MKNKLPGGIDKKIPARFFHQIQLGWTARTGGGGRKPDRTRGGSRTYIYIYTRRVDGYIVTAADRMKEGTGWVPVNSKHPRMLPPVLSVATDGSSG